MTNQIERLEEQYSDLFTVKDEEVILHMPEEYGEFRTYYDYSAIFDKTIEMLFRQSGEQISRWSLRGFADEYAGKDIPMDREWFVATMKGEVE